MKASTSKERIDWSLIGALPSSPSRGWTNGLLLRAIREAAGVRRDTMAAAMGISYTHLANLETGRRRPSLTTLRVVESLLNLQPQRLAPLLDEKSNGVWPPTTTARCVLQGALSDVEQCGVVSVFARAQRALVESGKSQSPGTRGARVLPEDVQPLIGRTMRRSKK